MAFDVERVKQDLIAWLRAWFLQNGDGCSAVIGISGGKDSSVTAALCVAALGKERVLGVLMPNGVQYDIADAKLLVRHLGIRHYVVNIAAAYAGVASEAGGTFVMGFPFESIESDVQRDRLMRDVLDFLLKQKDR